MHLRFHRELQDGYSHDIVISKLSTPSHSTHQWRPQRLTGLYVLALGLLCFALQYTDTTIAAPQQDPPQHENRTRIEGISTGFPGDKDIHTHPKVLFAEDFETGSLSDLEQTWDSVSNERRHVLAWSTDVPEGSPGKRSLEFTARVPDNTGGHLYRRFPREVDRAHARFYVKFDPANSFTHHFVTLGAYNPSTPWPQGGAGSLPKGNERITVGIEPTGDNGRYAAPGAWFFYTYWHEMKVSADGRYWGNGLRPVVPQLVPKDRWQCVEFMIQLNSKPDAHDGELVLWLDGAESARFGPDSRRGPWTGTGFTLAEDSNSEPFNGFQWRTSNELKLNFLWLLHFVTEDANRQHRVEKPNPINRVWFDHIVVAEDYIGPIGKSVVPKTSPTNP